MTYRYIGHRRNKGTDEALVDLRGTVKGARGNGANLVGRVVGTATVDLTEGRVTQASATTSVDLDIALNGRPAKANGKLEVRLTRKPAPAPAAKPAEPPK